MAGLEPARAVYGPTDFKSVASTIPPHRRCRLNCSVFLRGRKCISGASAANVYDAAILFRQRHARHRRKYRKDRSALAFLNHRLRRRRFSENHPHSDKNQGGT